MTRTLEGIGYATGVESSYDGARLAALFVDNQHELVMNFIRLNGSSNQDEFSLHTGIKSSTVSARFNELEHMGFIEKRSVDGKLVKRVASSGIKTNVYFIKPWYKLGGTN